MSLYKLSLQLREYKKTFHTCPLLMEKKQELEKLVRSLDKCELKTHFKIPYRHRKVLFYKDIEKYLLDNDLCKKILQIQKEILDIYKEKENHLVSLEHLVDEADFKLSCMEYEMDN
jgi:hypothetical protein